MTKSCLAMLWMANKQGILYLKIKKKIKPILYVANLAIINKKI